MGTSSSRPVECYARRMATGNAIFAAIDLFHMDALPTAVPMKVDLDLSTHLHG